MGAGAPPRDPEGGLAARVLRRELEGLRDVARRSAAVARAIWARRPSPQRLVAIAFVAAALATGALAVLAQARLPERLPSPRDWAAVAALLERDGRPGDAIALSPPWAERARAVLPPSIPILANARYEGEDLVGVRRLWLLSIPAAPGFSWDTEAALLQRAARPRRPERIGAFEVARYDFAFPTLPLAFLPDRLAQAEVSRGADVCPPDASGAFRCEGGHVAREVRDVGGAPRPCLVAALGEGAPIVIAFPPVRVGRRVRGHAGALGAAAAPLRVSVVVDGEEAGSAEISGPGFVPFEVDTTRFGGELRRLSLVLTSSGAGADVCLDAVTLP
jgi:hypothetical protein